MNQSFLLKLYASWTSLSFATCAFPNSMLPLQPDRQDSRWAQPSRGFHRLWPIGTLDPARHARWPSGNCPGMATNEVAPSFVLYIARDKNIGSASNVDCYLFPDFSEPRTVTPRFGARSQMTFLVDFGRTMPGSVAFDAKVPVGTQMTVETGESMVPLRTYPVTPAPNGERQTFHPVIAHDGWGSLRFAWIHFDAPPGPVTLYDMYGLYRVFPCDYVGDFSCSDDELTRIWEMCAYSAHAVMQSNGLLQTLCLDRVDRFPFAGDSRVIQTAVLDVFGQYGLVRSNLEGFARSGRGIGGIAPYQLDWVLAVLDYFMSSGDADFVRVNKGKLLAILDKYASLPTRWQDIKQPANCAIWMFFDWDQRIARTIDRQTAAAFAGKYVQTCQKMAEAAAFLNDPETVEHAKALARKHTDQWRELYLVDWNMVYGLHPITNLILGDVLHTPEEKRAAYDRAFADRSARWSNTPYFGTYILMALAKIDRHAEAVEMLHDYWGSMIDAGATTTWEEWSPDIALPVNAQPPQFGPPDTWGGLSLIQPAGSGPVRWLLAEVVGIRPETPGYQRVRITPHPCGLSWAKGVVATPLGPVSVHWQLRSNQMIVAYETPETCQGVTLVIPESSAYELDGKRIDAFSCAGKTALLKLPAGEHEVICGKGMLK